MHRLFKRSFAHINTKSDQSISLFANGISKLELQDYEQARSCFLQSLEISPCSDAYFNLGNCEYSLGNPKSALYNWKESLKLQERADAHVNIANAYALSFQDVPSAISHYEKAIELKPDDPEIRFNYAAVLDASQRLQEAIEQYKQAEKLGVKVERHLLNAIARLAGKKHGNK